MIIPAMSLTLHDGLLDTDTCFAWSTSATDQCQSTADERGPSALPETTIIVATGSL